MQIIVLVAPIIIPLEIFNVFFRGYSSGNGTALLFLFLINLAIYPIYQGAFILYLASALKNSYLGKNEYYNLSKKIWPTLLIVYITKSLAISLGLLLFIVPGLILAVRLSYAEIYCVLSKSNLNESINRSFKETNDHQLVILSGLLIILLVGMSIIFLIQGLLKSGIGENYITTFIFSLLSYIPVFMSTIFVFRVFDHQNSAKSDTE
ncbi:MAG: YciC family protein [Cellvibrionaceae bacterium]